ncbi:uncharacterized protein [Henckelia pumila]|uniref:uncharacterized protein n=1 Tax=Henckelia pumila TaxID=405737 RepID=UPI003C6E34BA
MWSSKHPPIFLRKVCYPIEDGGLGIRDLRSWNKALLAKTLRNIHMKKDSLWVRWVHQYYWSEVVDWRKRKDDTMLIHKLVEIHDELVLLFGSWKGVMLEMSHWFGGRHGLTEDYRCFIPGQGRWPWKPFLWKPHILPKHRFALLIFAHGKFLTKDRQPYVLEKECGFCRDVHESAHHLFFDCTVARQLWGRFWMWMGVQCSVGSSSGLLRLLRGRFRGTTLRSRRCQTGIAVLIYHIWSARNRAVFEDYRPDADAIFRKTLIHIHRSLYDD